MEGASISTMAPTAVSIFQQRQLKRSMKILRKDFRLYAIIGEEETVKYERISEGIFLNRPNRFVAQVETKEGTQLCHVKNTGRCRELFLPGARVYLQESDRPGRKTRFDLVGVEKQGRIVNVDSQIPNRAVEEWLRKGNLFQEISLLKPEARYANSRFDLYLEADGERAFMEIKGVTLEEEGVARFPDAPTQRGVKHIQELIACKKEGYGAYMVFVVQMKGVLRLEPNDKTHPEFGQALREAARAGVRILAYDCLVTRDSICLDRPVEIGL